eukprot:3418340-Pleurochrysis_carterae.AAC.2
MRARSSASVCLACVCLGACAERADELEFHVHLRGCACMLMQPCALASACKNMSKTAEEIPLCIHTRGVRALVRDLVLGDIVPTCSRASAALQSHVPRST